MTKSASEPSGQWVDNLLYRSEAICPRVNLLGYPNQRRDLPMRAKMLLFALSALAGFGQDANLLGLPEYGNPHGGH